MAKMTFDTTGVEARRTGFEPYEGPMPKPGVYNATLKQARMRISQAGNPYFNLMWELGPDANKAEKNAFIGCPVWQRVVPGEAEIQQIRVAQLLIAVCGKQKANVVHDEVQDGGKISKIGGKDPVGTHAKLVISRRTYNDEIQPEVDDILPWPKDEEFPTGPAEAADADEDEEEETESEDSDEEDEEDEDAEDDEESEDEDDDEDEEEEEEDDDEDDAAYNARKSELEAMDRAALKKVAKSLEIRVLKSMDEEDLREAILESEFPGDDDEEETDGEPF